MNDFTLESQNCVMQFKLDTENNLLSLEMAEELMTLSSVILICRFTK